MQQNPALWERVKERVKRGSKGGLPGQWSARKAQLAVKIYKDEGGKYKGNKRGSLHKWTEQHWRTKSGKPSLETGERYLPEKAIKALTPAEYRRTSSLKRKTMRMHKQFSKQPRSIARKTRKYRI